MYYFEFPYLRLAALFLAATLIAVGAVLYRGLRNGSPALLIVPVFLFLVGAIFSSKLQPLAWTVNDDHYLSNFAFDIDEWSGGHKRYPSNDAEIQEALRSKTRDDELARGGAFPLPRESHYRLRGLVVPYQVVLVPNAAGPRLIPATRPAVVYYSVSPDLHECWLTMTVLAESTPGSLNLFKVGGHPYIIHKALRDGWSRTEQ